MMRSFRNLSLYFILISILFGCASQSNIQGGPRDMEPPKIILEKSSPNYQTQFKQGNISLLFNEFIKLQDPQNQIVVTPTLSYPPKLDILGKKLIIRFNEKELFREETTYTIQFGKAIQDITEGNTLENITWVFSTGNQLDSITVSGKVLEFESGKPAKGALVMLYDQLADSALYLSKPVYFTYTDSIGQYTLQFLKPGQYQMAALKEEKTSYRYDQSGEWVGFQAMPLTIMEDSSMAPDIFLFQEVSPPIIQDVDSTQKGTLMVRFDQELTGVTVQFSAEPSRVQYEADGKQLTLWHSHDSLLKTTLKIIHTSGKSDSLRMVSYPLNTDMRKKDPTLISPLDKKKIHPDSAALLKFSAPINTFNSAKWEIFKKKDSLNVAFNPSDLVALDNPPQNFKLPVLPPGEYTVRIAPEGITDRFGTPNTMPIVCVFSIPTIQEFVLLELVIDSLDPELNYMFRLLENNKTVDEWSSSGKEQIIRNYPAIAIGKYQLEYWYDDNQNRRWDGGNYLLKQYPELKSILPLEPLRPDWDSKQRLVIPVIKR